MPQISRPFIQTEFDVVYKNEVTPLTGSILGSYHTLEEAQEAARGLWGVPEIVDIKINENVVEYSRDDSRRVKTTLVPKPAKAV